MNLTTPIRGMLASLCLVLGSSVAATLPLSDVERRIITVSEWGGTAANPALARKQEITHITLHHQGEPFKAGTDPQAYLRKLQTWSRNSKQWLDIPYHYVIDLDGRIYEARKLEYAGDTTPATTPRVMR